MTEVKNPRMGWLVRLWRGSEQVGSTEVEHSLGRNEDRDGSSTSLFESGGTVELPGGGFLIRDGDRVHISGGDNGYTVLTLAAFRSMLSVGRFAFDESDQKCDLEDERMPKGVVDDGS